MPDLTSIYHALYREYGPQGWWPLCRRNKLSVGGDFCRYHPGKYPRLTHRERFEIGVGAILTQNTTFASVTECLLNLHRIEALIPDGLLCLSPQEIAVQIIPARYANRKAEYLITWAEFFQGLGRRIPTRKEILSLRGIGEETADSILLYAFSQAEFVIDAYTLRILAVIGHEKFNYQQAKLFFEAQLIPAFPDYRERVTVYQEYHALLVTHAKYFYSRKPYGKFKGKFHGKADGNSEDKDCFLKFLL